MVEWHDVTFRVPKLGTLSDLQLEKLFYGRDGPWSETMKAAQLKFRVDKLDLEDNWASCTPDWACPACGRHKPDLLRVSDKGVLLARLEIHHDHLTDYFKSILHAQLGPQWRASIPPGTEHLEKLGSSLVARFEPTRVCIDCNGADATVKSRNREIPRYFSFRPSEIRQFVRPRPNGEHDIDFERANDLFRQALEDFGRRVALVESLATLTLSGGMTREAGNLPPPWLGDSTVVRNFLYDWFSRGCAQSSAIYDDMRQFEARSVSRDGTASNPKKKKVPIARPTDAEIVAYDGGGAPELWNAAPPDWQCPACGRDRGDIIRRSNNPKRPWAGKLVRHTEYILSEGVADEEDDFTVEAFVDRHEYHLICLDCATILTGVKGRSSAISASSAIFQLRDMAAVAKAAPNRSHEVDWEAAAERARASLPFAELVASYSRHLSDAVGCRARYRSYLARCGGNEKRAWANLRAYYADEGAEAGDTDEMIVWLLSEADRIGIKDPYRPKAGEDAAAASA